MEGRVTKALDGLGVAERDVIDRRGIGIKVASWARLIGGFSDEN